jgi:hypothetical protein
MDFDDWEPGSPRPLYIFQRWCRSVVELAVLQFEVPSIFFVDGPELEEPVTEQWQMRGSRPSWPELARRLVPSLAAERLASQVGVSIPFGGDTAGVVLLALDETGVVAERAQASVVDDHVELGPWTAQIADDLPVAAWQQLLAANAGYEEFSKWCCLRCRSVCPGEAALCPAPCDFCGSEDVARVPLATPLAPPAPPYDQRRFDGPFLEALLGMTDHGR